MFYVPVLRISLCFAIFLWGESMATSSGKTTPPRAKGQMTQSDSDKKLDGYAESTASLSFGSLDKLEPGGGEAILLKEAGVKESAVREADGKFLLFSLKYNVPEGVKGKREIAQIGFLKLLDKTLEGHFRKMAAEGGKDIRILYAEENPSRVKFLLGSKVFDQPKMAMDSEQELPECVRTTAFITFDKMDLVTSEGTIVDYLLKAQGVKPDAVREKDGTVLAFSLRYDVPGEKGVARTIVQYSFVKFLDKDFQVHFREMEKGRQPKTIDILYEKEEPIAIQLLWKGKLREPPTFLTGAPVSTAWKTDGSPVTFPLA